MDREAEITKRIELLRKKNEQLLQRHKEIEADREYAEKSGRSVRVHPIEVTTRHIRKDAAIEQHTNAHMDDLSEQRETRNEGRRKPEHNPRGRGKTSSDQSSRNSQNERTGYRHSNAHTDNHNEQGDQRYDSPHPRRPDKQATSRGRANPRVRSDRRGRGRGAPQDYDMKRMENFRLLEEEMAQTQTEEQNSAIAGVSRFLDDPRRKGDLNPEERWKSTRHRGNYGGMEFGNAKRGVRGQRNGNYRGNQGRGYSKLQMTAEMTGRERRDQERWLSMREAADKEIQARSRNAQGQWRRAWDANKDSESDAIDHHISGEVRNEERRSHPIGGRGKRGGRGRGKSSGRRGSHSQSDSHDRKEIENEEVDESNPPLEVRPQEAGKTQEDSLVEVTENPTRQPEAGTEVSHVETPGKPVAVAKAQRQRRHPKGDRKIISPRHLAQQRANTPSSKDGTELWAQNSHHSDETGMDWKNRANRSTEQWLPSDEGNRNPAIDERMLEQQEDGATVYSRQLGRGWGDEKNIKATKAWVIDTEKAGATRNQPDVVEEGGDRGRNEGRTFRKMHTEQRQVRTEASRLKEDSNDKTRLRSASPRLKRDNLGLTVEIPKGGQRRVKRYSEGDSLHVDQSQVTADPVDSGPLPEDVQSPASAGAMKTPEGVTYVADWAAEMDLQSPTYAKRHLLLDGDGQHGSPETILNSKTESKTKPSPEENKVSGDSTSNLDVKSFPCQEDAAVEHEEGDKTLKHDEVRQVAPDKVVCIEKSSENELHDNNDSAVDCETVSKDISISFNPDDDRPQDDAANAEPHINMVEKDSEAQVNSDANVVEDEDASREAMDGNFRDAVDLDEDDEFYECDEDDNEQKKVGGDGESPKDEQATEGPKDASAETPVSNIESTAAPIACSASESIQGVVTETVSPLPVMSPPPDIQDDSNSDNKIVDTDSADAQASLNTGVESVSSDNH